MGMSMHFENVILTNGDEKRLDNNDFQLVKEGYHFYPMDTALLVKRNNYTMAVGEGIIKKLQFEDRKTTIVYKLTVLKGTN